MELDADLDSECDDSFPGDLSQLADLVELADSDDPHAAGAGAFGASAAGGAAPAHPPPSASSAPRRKAVSFHSNTGLPPSKKITTGKRPPGGHGRPRLALGSSSWRPAPRRPRC